MIFSTKKVLVLVTDGARYMKLVGQILCSTFNNLIHITCLSHALHNVCESIVSDFSDCNRLISCGKKIFLKSNQRRNEFKVMYKGVPLPPEPVRTRWGSWLRSVEYYSKHYNQFSDFVNSLDSNDSIYIKEAKDVMKNSELSNEFLYIVRTVSVLRSVLTDKILF